MPLPAETVDAMQKALFDLGAFAELVEYRPFGGSPVNIRAVVERDGDGVMTRPGEQKALTQKQLHMEIPNRSDWGRTSISDKDRIVIGMRYGDAPIECRIVSRVRGDEVSFRVRVGT